MMKIFIAVFFLGFAQIAGAEKEFLWKDVGGDPCSPRYGCTLQWALSQTDWPTEAKAGLAHAVKTEVSKQYTVQSGWRGWMTWGRWKPKFKPNTVAAWPTGHTEIADLWSVDVGTKRYNLIRVDRCKNWGGFVSEPVMVPVKKQTPIEIPIGVLPSVDCGETNQQLVGQEPKGEKR